MTAKVFHSELWGKRESKYTRLLDSDLRATEWAGLSPAAPLYLFVPLDVGLSAEYAGFWSVSDIFPVNSVGIVTARDTLTIRWSAREVWDTVRDLASLPAETARQRYNLGKDARDWKVHLAQQDIRETGPDRRKIFPILYRPFDIRFTYYTGRTRGFICRPRPDVMGHMLSCPNLGLATSRQTPAGRWLHVLAASCITDDCYLSNRTREHACLSPVYVCAKRPPRVSISAGDGRRAGRVPNLNPEFVAEMERRLRLRFIPDGRGNLGTFSQGSRKEATENGRGTRTGIPPENDCPQHPPQASETRDAGPQCTAGVPPAVSGASRPRDPRGGQPGQTTACSQSHAEGPRCTAGVPPAVSGASRPRDPQGGQPGQTTACSQSHAEGPRCTAGVPPAVSGASRPRFGDVTIRDRGRLPHWETQGAVYFVTFRLADSLPRPVLDGFEAERAEVLKRAEQMGREPSPAERKRLSELFSQRIEAHLDRGCGACDLSHPRVAQLVADSLRHFDGQRYRLFAWRVMPNHVHVVFRPIGNYSLAGIVQSWKSFTAKRANRILGREGTLWQREYYDHLVRDENDFHRVVQYIVDNPVEARLSDWPWLWVCGQDARTTAGETPAVRGPEGNAALSTAAGVSGAFRPRCGQDARAIAGETPAVQGQQEAEHTSGETSASAPTTEPPGGRADSMGTFGPEDVFHYIYAVFHSPTYRKRYAEFLKRDFPRVPLTSDLSLFRTLCQKGADLVALHLVEGDYEAASWNRRKPPQLSPFQRLISRYPVAGEDLVEKVFYVAPGEPEPGTGKPLPHDSGRVYISTERPPGKSAEEGKKAQYFEGVPPEAWEFHIGGYQVCEKWLKDRKGRKLSYDDIQHYHKIVVALKETIRLMSEIDAAIPRWPIG